MNKLLLIVLLFVYGCTKKDKKNHHNSDTVFEGNKVVKTKIKNIHGKIFYRIIYETKDSLVVGKFDSYKNNVIGFLTKDSLFYANGIDGGFMKINSINKKTNNSFEINIISFDNKIKDKKKLSLKLKYKDEGLWIIDKNGHDFYEVNDGETYIDKSYLDSIKIISKEEVDFPDAFNEDNEDEYFFYKIKTENNRGDFITKLKKIKS